MAGYKQIKPRWKKGESGNPAGKPKGTFSLLNLLKAEIQKCPEGQDKKTYGDLIIQRMLADSIKKGDIQHIKTIWAYLEGMPKEHHDLTTLGEKIMPIYAGNSRVSIQRCDSNTKSIQSEEENTRGSRGDISE